MLRFFHVRGIPARLHAQARDHSLQICLWVLWTIAVGAAAYWTWHAAMHAGHAFSPAGMAVHCGTVGVIGLVLLTWVEMKLQPERFLD